MVIGEGFVLSRRGLQRGLQCAVALKCGVSSAVQSAGAVSMCVLEGRFQPQTFRMGKNENIFLKFEIICFSCVNAFDPLKREREREI